MLTPSENNTGYNDRFSTDMVCLHVCVCVFVCYIIVCVCVFTYIHTYTHTHSQTSVKFSPLSLHDKFSYISKEETASNADAVMRLMASNFDQSLQDSIASDLPGGGPLLESCEDALLSRSLADVYARAGGTNVFSVFLLPVCMQVHT